MKRMGVGRLHFFLSLLGLLILGLLCFSHPRKIANPGRRSHAVGPYPAVESPSTPSANPERIPPFHPVAASARESVPILKRILAALQTRDRGRLRTVLAEALLEFSPWAPEAENAASLFRAAFEHYAKPTRDEESARIRLFQGKEIGPEERALLQAFLSRNMVALTYLHDAARRPVCVFRRSPDLWDEFEAPGLLKQQQASDLLRLESKLSEGSARADAVRAHLRLARAGEDEPYLIGNMIQIALRRSALETLADSRDVPIESLPLLDPLRVRGDFKRAVLGELLLELGSVAWDDGAAQNLLNTAGGLNDARAWLDLSECVNRVGRLCDLLDRPYFEIRDSLALMRAEDDKESSPIRSLPVACMESAESAAKSEAYAAAWQIASAARRFHSVSGSFPGSLADLSDAIPHPPIDPLTGTSFRYRVDGDRVLVYGLGLDRVDQGGSGDDIGVRFPR